MGEKKEVLCSLITDTLHITILAHKEKCHTGSSHKLSDFFYSTLISQFFNVAVDKYKEETRKPTPHSP